MTSPNIGNLLLVDLSTPFSPTFDLYDLSSCLWAEINLKVGFTGWVSVSEVKFSHKKNEMMSEVKRLEMLKCNSQVICYRFGFKYEQVKKKLKEPEWPVGLCRSLCLCLLPAHHPGKKNTFGHCWDQFLCTYFSLLQPKRMHYGIYVLLVHYFSMHCSIVQGIIIVSIQTAQTGVSTLPLWE